MKLWTVLDEDEVLRFRRAARRVIMEKSCNKILFVAGSEYADWPKCFAVLLLFLLRFSRATSRKICSRVCDNVMDKFSEHL